MWSVVRFFLSIVLTSAALVLPAHNATTTRATEVDLLLALAVDVSRSIDEHKFNLQRDGYYAAIKNPRVIEAIRSGRFGRIAVCYIEWSGLDNQKLLIDWTVIHDEASAHRFATQLAETPRAFNDLTSISGGIDFAMGQIERAPFEARRRVIDVSGDGDDNNSGREVRVARDQAIARGGTINAVVVLTDQLTSWDISSWERNVSSPPRSGLETYYRENVIGGPGAFVMVARDYASFGDAIINKFVAEIAGLPVTHVVASGAKHARHATVR